MISLKQYMQGFLGCLVFPLLAQAATTSYALNSQAVADNNIIQLLGKLHGDLLNGQRQQSDIWSQNVQMKAAELLPPDNGSFLLKTSLYPNFANAYVFKPLAKIPGSTQLNSVEGYSFVCSGLTSVQSSVCKDRPSSSQPSLFYSYDANRLMPFAGQTLQNFSFSPSFVTNLVNSSQDDSSGVNSALNQYPAASVARHVLDSVGKQYDTTDQGYNNPGSAPSQMQVLKKTVQAPFSKAYLNTLAHATNPQVGRALAEIAAEGNYMKFKQIKQNQSIKVLLSTLVIEQLRTNVLLHRNLRELKKLEKRQKNL